MADDTVGGVVHFQISGLELNTPYFFAVTAYNAAGESAYSNEKRVQFDASDVPPVANAGPDRVATVGQTLRLGTTAQPGTNYIWFQRAGPAEVLETRTSSTASFTSRVPGAFELVQVAFDQVGLASSDSVTIVVTEPATTPATVPPTRQQTTPTTPPTLPATATLARDPTRTPTATGTPTPTDTPGSTDAAESTPTPTATDHSPVAPSAACSEAIDGDSVTLALLASATDILLDQRPLESCPALDLNGDGALRLNEVVRLVVIALGQAP